MTLAQEMQCLDRRAGTMLAVLALSAVSLIAYINWLGVSVSLHTTNPEDQISPYEPLTFIFSQAVRQRDVENQLELQPSIPGKLDWQDDHTARFVPAKAYQGKISVRLVRGQLGANGDWLRNDAAWTLTVRQPAILYLNYADPKNELMVIPAQGGTPRELTSTGGRIYDFDVSPSGDAIVYSMAKDQGGMDLWLIDRDGQNPRRLLDCGASRCSSPIWSPDGTLIAYDREAAGLTANSPTGAPRPWVINVQTADNRPAFSDPQAIGYGILWSPDGNWLSTYDGIAAQIRVINLKSGQQVSLPSNIGLLGSWSPDSSSLIYTDQTTGVNNILKTYLYRADFKTGQVSIFLGKTSDTADYAYGNPVWSPSGDQIVVSMRPDPQKLGRQLWVIQPDTLGGPTITNGPSYTYDSYQWDPWGTGLAIQRDNLGSTFKPEVGVWYPGQEFHIVVENALSPHWLP